LAKGRKSERRNLLLNIVRELRKKKGIQQKELAIAIGVSCPTVSAWESNKKDPSGERLKKLANYFNVDELFILGYGLENPSLFVPTNPQISGISQTEQIAEYILNKLESVQVKDSKVPKTPEARIVSGGMDKLPKEQREQILNVVRAMFAQHPELFKEEKETDDTEL
jgi:transcriptional regulator with XRE-family HTH domain